MCFEAKRKTFYKRSEKLRKIRSILFVKTAVLQGKVQVKDRNGGFANLFLAFVFFKRTLER